MDNQLPKKGFVFWPVGTGDSTSVAIDDDAVFQVDLHHLESANDDDDPHTPIVDVLVESLPQRDGTPYLAGFALTHPDTDHIKGFEDLNDRVLIGELWFTPRVFREYKNDLGDDATAFKEEAMRRTKLMIKHEGNVDSGDRVRLIGYDELLHDPEFQGFPPEYHTVPGNWITEIDRMDLSSVFEAFIHGPFKDDSAGDRNETSLAMQVSLLSPSSATKALLFGDLSYPTIRKIFDTSKEAGNEVALEWNTFLGPHHCSKSVMYHRDEGDNEETLKKDILADLEQAQRTPGYIVVSSEPIPATNNPGDNPPHAKAKARYQEIVNDDFICTQEHGGEDDPSPVIFQHTDDGLVFLEPDSASTSQDEASSDLAAAVAAARGDDQPPQDKVGFGKK